MVNTLHYDLFCIIANPNRRLLNGNHAYHDKTWAITSCYSYTRYMLTN